MDDTRNTSASVYYPLTDAQVMLLWEEAFAPVSEAAPPCNVLHFYLKVPQGDRLALTRAYNKLIETNDSLRLRLFRLERPTLRQSLQHYRYVISLPFWRWIHRIRQYIEDYAYEELPLVQVADQAALAAYLGQVAQKGMRVVGDRLCHGELIAVGEENLILLLRFHHILADGFSSKLLYIRLTEYYLQYCQGIEPAPKSYSITRYLSEDQKYRQSTRFKDDFRFWKKAFHSQPQYSFPAGRTPTTSYLATYKISVDSELYQAAKALAAAHGSSLYSLMMTIAAFTVYRLTGRTNFAIFHMSHGRLDVQGKQTIGNMINMLPVFFRFEPGQSCQRLIQDCGMNYLESLRHSRLPFNELVKFYARLAMLHGFIFNHAWFVMSSIDFAAAYAKLPFESGFIDAQNQPHQFFAEVDEIPGEQVFINLKYQIPKYTEAKIKEYLAVMVDTLRQVVADPEQPLTRLRGNR